MRIPITFFLCVALLVSGCTSVRSMEGAGMDRLKAGELATVFEHDGRVSRLLIDTVKPESIAGQYPGTGNRVTIMRSDIRAVEVERVDYVKSAAAGVGGIVATAAALLLGLVMLVAAAGG